MALLLLYLFGFHRLHTRPRTVVLHAADRLVRAHANVICLFGFQTRDRLFVRRVCLDISRFCRLKIALYVVLYLVTRDIFVLCPLNGEAFFLRSELCDSLLCGQYLEGLANSSLVTALARDGNFRLADCGVGRVLYSVINVLFQRFAVQRNRNRGLLILSIKLDTLTARILKLSSDGHSRIVPMPFYSGRKPADR